MIKVNLICVGKIKEKYFADAVSEYTKRLKRYCDISITEVADEKCPEGLSRAEEANIKLKEGRTVLKALKDSFIIALAIDGKMLNSTEFAEFIDKKTSSGISSFTFIIGGSLGLSDEVLKKADQKISFSRMTFPHQLMRVIFLEQLYRSQRILKNEPYHK